MLSVCVLLERFFFSRESACDQHRANQHYPDRGSGVLHPPRTERKLLLQALVSALLKSQDCSDC
ncbi:unnamed protein product [Staurois parvus]|uniref:Uncharacterized protein n=1 Tax=Staurois parvus TaxID=386267 RepID=A0ABN9HRG6_9NEOB|nr:unnamed protein product [Staurois parvus]